MTAGPTDAACLQPMLHASMPAFLVDAGELDRAGSVPLWMSLKNLLSEALLRHAVVPGSPLPSEHDLCTLYQVSRPVVRAALEGLVREGQIVKIQRRGAFVAKPRQDLDFASSNIGIFAELRAKGHEVQARVLQVLRGAPTQRERDMLGLPLRSEVVRVVRVYVSDGQPVATGTIVYPGHRVIGIEKADLTNRSMYSTLRERYGLSVVRSERWLSALLPTREQARLLELPPETPVIEIESLGWTGDGTPLEYYVAIYRTDIHRIHVVTHQRGDEAPDEIRPSPRRRKGAAP